MAKYVIKTPIGVKPYYYTSKRSVANAIKRMKKRKGITVYQVTKTKLKRVPLKSFKL